MLNENTGKRLNSFLKGNAIMWFFKKRFQATQYQWSTASGKEYPGGMLVFCWNIIFCTLPCVFFHVAEPLKYWLRYTDYDNSLLQTLSPVTWLNLWFLSQPFLQWLFSGIRKNTGICMLQIWAKVWTDKKITPLLHNNGEFKSMEQITCRKIIPRPQGVFYFFEKTELRPISDQAFSLSDIGNTNKPSLIDWVCINVRHNYSINLPTSR